MAKTTHERLQDHLSGAPSEPVPEKMDPETGEVTIEPDEDYSQGESDPTQVISKITIATCGGNPSRAKALNQRVPVLAIYGRATDVKMVEDGTRKNPDGSTKEWAAISGAFKAINLETNQIYMSGLLYLPGGFHELLTSLVEKHNEQKSRKGMAGFKQGIEFSYQIDATPSRNPSGYSYTLRSLLPARPADPLAALHERTVNELQRNKHLALPAA